MRIKIKNRIWSQRSCYFCSVAEFNNYEGVEVKLKWTSPEQLAMTTGIIQFPVRVLDKNLIVEIDGLPYEYSTAETAKIKLVAGSKGQTYTVTEGRHCTCTGFTFRGSCKHLRMAA